MRYLLSIGRFVRYLIYDWFAYGRLVPNPVLANEHRHLREFVTNHPPAPNPRRASHPSL